MVDHRSTGLPECGPTESSAPEPCFFYFFQFLVELQFYVITATAVINFSTTALEPQPRFLKIPQPKQETQPRFSENSQPIHHYILYLHHLFVYLSYLFILCMFLQPIKFSFHSFSGCQHRALLPGHTVLPGLQADASERFAGCAIPSHGPH